MSLTLEEQLAKAYVERDVLKEKYLPINARQTRRSAEVNFYKAMALYEKYSEVIELLELEIKLNKIGEFCETEC